MSTFAAAVIREQERTQRSSPHNVAVGAFPVYGIIVR